MDRKSFLKLLRELYFPELRGIGFKGSGTTLRRINEPVIHVVNIQGSSSFETCYVNLGAHLTFLPTEGGGSFIPNKIKEYECSFRKRVVPPSDSSHPGCWPYGHNEKQARSVIEQLVVAWKNQGERFFSALSSYPQDFTRIVRNAILDPPHPRDALTFGRIGMELGMHEEAEVIAKHALKTVAPTASTLIARLKSLLRDLDS